MGSSVKFLATAIGSFPHDDPGRALDVIFSSIPDAVVWPQLPKLGLTEQMEIQYSEGMPRAIIDTDKGRMYFDTTGDYSDEFASFYENYMTAMEDGAGIDSMAIGEEYSRGIYALEDRLQSAGKKREFVKVQTTGPCSFALTVVDENKRAIYYNEEFRDVIVKALALKSRWQIRKFSRYAGKVICFIDEPILSAFGSSTYISVKREDVVANIAEVVDAIHMDGGLAGVHCCGNTDWSILIDAGVDMVNLDAYGFGETIALYPGPVKAFLGRGGLIAWGIVPTSVAIRDETADSLVARFDSTVGVLSSKSGIAREDILNSSVITPSCGTGSMSVPDAEKVFETLSEVSLRLREKY